MGHYRPRQTIGFVPLLGDRHLSWINIKRRDLSTLRDTLVASIQFRHKLLQLVGGLLRAPSWKCALTSPRLNFLVRPVQPVCGVNPYKTLGIHSDEGTRHLCALAYMINVLYTSLDNVSLAILILSH